MLTFCKPSTEHGTQKTKRTRRRIIAYRYGGFPVPFY